MKCPFCIKVCSQCGKILVVCEMNFSKQKGGKYGLRAYCKDCQKKYYEANKEHYNKYHKQWYQDNAEYFKQWKKNNPEKVLNNRNRYRSGLESNITREQYDQMLSFFDNKCAYSGEPFNDNLSIDHIIPLEAGGTNDISNLVPCCSLYNCCKFTNDLPLWYMNQPFYSKERLNKILAWIEYAQHKWN